MRPPSFGDSEAMLTIENRDLCQMSFERLYGMVSQRQQATMAYLPKLMVRREAGPESDQVYQVVRC